MKTNTNNGTIVTHFTFEVRFVDDLNIDCRSASALQPNLTSYRPLQTGDERYKELENRVFAGQGRFVVEKGKSTIVEYKVGQVVAG